MSSPGTQDKVVLALTAIVGFFVVATMVSLVVGSFMGLQGGENIWAGLFSLATAILGAVGGFIGGQQVERNRTNGKPPDQ